MEDVYKQDREECRAMAEIVLTPIVVRNSVFRDHGVTSNAQTVLAASTATRPNTPVEERKTSPNNSVRAANPNLLSDVQTEEQNPTSNMEVHLSQSKTIRNFVIECDEYFMNKSKSRILTMTKALQCRKNMSWVRAVASKLETGENYEPWAYEALTDSHRHIHRTGSEVSDFVRALADPSVKTFSWHLNDKEAVLIQKCREALQQRCSKNKPEQYLPLAMVVCSIGLPTFQLYTPCSFFEKWRPFKDVTNDNIVKALFRRPGTTVSKLLDEYSPADVVVDGEPGTVELLMFKYWYSHPTKVMLGRLVEYANANLERCLGINDKLGKK